MLLYVIVHHSTSGSHVPGCTVSHVCMSNAGHVLRMTMPRVIYQLSLLYALQENSPGTGDIYLKSVFENSVRQPEAGPVFESI